LNLATLLEKEERYEDAINALIRGAEGSGEHNDLALFAAARLYGRLGRLDEARHTLNAFLRRWKGEPEIKVRALKTLNQLTGE
jgi:tetratricopeptide (TPR) repeat protein